MRYAAVGSSRSGGDSAHGAYDASDGCRHPGISLVDKRSPALLAGARASREGV
jgi:hypothetical protein